MYITQIRSYDIIWSYDMILYDMIHIIWLVMNAENYITEWRWCEDDEIAWRCWSKSTYNLRICKHIWVSEWHEDITLGCTGTVFLIWMQSYFTVLSKLTERLSGHRQPYCFTKNSLFVCFFYHFITFIFVSYFFSPDLHHGFMGITYPQFFNIFLVYT